MQKRDVRFKIQGNMSKVMLVGPVFTVTSSHVNLLTTSDLPLVNSAFL